MDAQNSSPDVAATAWNILAESAATAEEVEPRVPSAWMALAYTATRSEKAVERMNAARILAELVAAHCGVQS